MKHLVSFLAYMPYTSAKGIFVNKFSCCIAKLLPAVIRYPTNEIFVKTMSPGQAAASKKEILVA